jgi:hypothetical protein
MIFEKIPENPSIMNGDLHEWIFLQDFNKREVGSLVGIF